MPEGFLRRNGGIKLINIDIFDGGRIVTYGTAVADSVLFEKIHFNFPAEWDGFAKTAVFTNGETKISVVLNENGKLCTGENECCIPHEVIKAPAFTVSVFGVSGDKRATTQIAQVSVKPSGYGEGATPAEPTPTEYEQLVAIADSAEQLAQSVRSDADSGAFKGDKGDKGDPGKDAVTDRAYSPTSENAQSGKAVAEALKAERTYANNSFSGALRGSASGEAVRLTDVSPLEHTLTVKLKSKNLLPFPYFHSSMLQAGITYTVNSDGTITANGTATGRSEFVLSANKSDWASGNYVLSGCPSGGSADTYSLQTINGFSDTGSGLQKNDTAEFARISIIIKKGTTVSNLVFKPQLELGTTPTAYTPYTTDFSGVTLKRYGKNLLPYPYNNTTKTTNGITFTDNGDGSVTISGTASDNAYFYLQRNADYGTQQINAIDKNSANNGVYTASSRIYYNAVNKTVTININPGTTLNETVYPQVELGVKATDYEAYLPPTEYTPSSDGTVTGVSADSEDITLMTDTAGVAVNAEYNKDINKVISELYALVNG